MASTAYSDIDARCWSIDHDSASSGRRGRLILDSSARWEWTGWNVLSASDWSIERRMSNIRSTTRALYCYLCIQQLALFGPTIATPFPILIFVILCGSGGLVAPIDGNPLPLPLACIDGLERLEMDPSGAAIGASLWGEPPSSHRMPEPTGHLLVNIGKTCGLYTRFLLDYGYNVAETRSQMSRSLQLNCWSGGMLISARACLDFLRSSGDDVWGPIPARNSLILSVSYSMMKGIPSFSRALDPLKRKTNGADLFSGRLNPDLLAILQVEMYSGDIFDTYIEMVHMIPAQFIEPILL